MKKLHEYELKTKVLSYEYSSPEEKTNHMFNMASDGYVVKAETTIFAQYEKSEKL